MPFELRCNSLEKPIYVFETLERAIAGLRSWLIHDIGIYFWIRDTSTGECVARASGARPELDGKKVPGRTRRTVGVEKSVDKAGSLAAGASLESPLQDSLRGHRWIHLPCPQG